MSELIKIALDCGHAIPTPGKQTPNGIKEWTINDKVRDKAVAILSGYNCEIIHTDYNEGATDEALRARRDMYVNAGVKAFVSIHHNAYTGDWNSATGVEVYVDKNPTDADNKLANCIYNRLVRNTGLKGRGIKKAAYTVINQNAIPAVLVEGGFMDGTNDYKVITSEAGQTAYAKAVAEGLIEFLGLTKKAPTPAPKKETTNTTTTNTKGVCKVELKQLSKGDKGSAVKALQTLLVGYGYSVGSHGIDGDFGTSTDAAVKKYQKAKGLKADGIVGAKTWAKLLGV